MPSKLPRLAEGVGHVLVTKQLQIKAPTLAQK